MDTTTLTQGPFAALTFIAAPALLTNASSVLALSTINRMLRTRERMQELLRKAESGPVGKSESAILLGQVARVQSQGALLLRGLRAVYIALAAFACATLITLIGASVAHFQDALWFHLLAGAGLLLGFLGAGGLVVACMMLFQSTQLSLQNMDDEAGLIRQRLAPPNSTRTLVAAQAKSNQD